MKFLKKLFKKEENKKNLEANYLMESEILFSDIKSKIYPYFKQLNPITEPTKFLPNDLSKIERNLTYEIPELRLVILNIVEDLNCLYVIDNELGLTLIQEDHLEKWNISKEKLHELALENFRSRIVTGMTARGDSNGIMFVIDGNLEAGLILIDEIWEQLEEQIGEEVVITIPSRDVLMATGKSNTVMIETFTENSKSILTSGDHPLSKNWFIRENGHWRFFKKILN